ncbi:uncharacterized protein BXZ73DRAFT_96383 [Epithele typhae]|uniref:uncharacterized protein n=1 Tax=Epithele typhae TaxID=378194 RepID=UPI00200863CA|nr:uncharacterized protein BXZ73DRAFT_96383 [Epithele typhae]KAH9945393.1 hypothetical protein BXZ73DRAFT_96383 [Epithele typhae]
MSRLIRALQSFSGVWFYTTYLYESEIPHAHPANVEYHIFASSCAPEVALDNSDAAVSLASAIALSVRLAFVARLETVWYFVHYPWIVKLWLLYIASEHLTTISAPIALITVLLPSDSFYVIAYYFGVRRALLSLFATLNARFDLRVQTEERTFPKVFSSTQLSASTSGPQPTPSSLMVIGSDDTSYMTPAPTTATSTYCDGMRCYVWPQPEDLGEEVSSPVSEDSGEHERVEGASLMGRSDSIEEVER